MKQINLPNILTILRVVSVPFFIYFLLLDSRLFRFLAFLLFTLASLTDLVDGYLARKWKQETELGKFLDPMADKALVLGAFLTFLFVSDQVQIWMVLIIIGRDMMITVLRWLAIQKGTSLKTSMFAKIKTGFQFVAIGGILISLFVISFKETRTINETYRAASDAGISVWTTSWNYMMIFFKGNAKSLAYGLASFLPFYMMVLTTFVTVISGVRYLITNYNLLWPLPRLNFKSRKAEDSSDPSDGN